MTDVDDVGRLSAAGISIGTCSWTDQTLISSGAFYPPEADGAEDRLRFYASQFPIVEVDSTYYGPPSERTAGLWVERTPGGFVFDVKAYRLLTQHPTPPRSLWKDIRDGLPPDVAAKPNVYSRDLPPELLEEAFRRFAAALMPLHSAGKLGVVLFQFPPYFYPTPPNREYLGYIAECLAEYQVAVEFRQARWMEDDFGQARTVELLAEHGLAYVAVDGPQGFKSSIPPVTAVTAPVAEVRFHGRNADTWEAPGLTAAERFRYDYRSEELEEWVPRILDLAEQARAVHVLMNNCYADYGIRSGRTMAALLAGAM